MNAEQHLDKMRMYLGLYARYQIPHPLYKAAEHLAQAIRCVEAESLVFDRFEVVDTEKPYED